MTIATIEHILAEAAALGTIKWLRPFAGLVDDLSISSDTYHGSHEGEDHPLSEIIRRYELTHMDGTS